MAAMRHVGNGEKGSPPARRSPGGHGGSRGGPNTGPARQDTNSISSAARNDSMSADLRQTAEQLEKQAAELIAHAQNCREMARMQEQSTNMPGKGYGRETMHAYPFLPMDAMPYPGDMPGKGYEPQMGRQDYGPKMGYGPDMMPIPAFLGAAGASHNEGKTTVMWRNIPNNFVREDLLMLIDSQGFKGKYDFFYSPVDFTSSALVGYAFINFVTTEDADRFYDTFQGYTDWSLKSDKISEIAWSEPLQGLEGHVERYRNSPVMHPDVSEDRRPLLFKDGKKIIFPKPTKKIRAPHFKECRPGK